MKMNWYKITLNGEIKCKTTAISPKMALKKAKDHYVARGWNTVALQNLKVALV